MVDSFGGLRVTGQLARCCSRKALFSSRCGFTVSDDLLIQFGFRPFGVRHSDVQGATMCVCCSLALTTGSSTMSLLPSPVTPYCAMQKPGSSIDG
jgi:hypothetical protein